MRRRGLVRARKGDEAFFKPKAGLFTSQLIRASLSNQPKTVDFLERSFEISIPELMKQNEG